jgi:hypothetical protein
LTAWGLAETCPAQSTASTVVTGALTVPGQRDAYVFQVSTNSRFYFDALTNVSAFEWSLSGPEGVVVQDRSFVSSDAESIGNPAISLPSGGYTLTVRSANDTTNGYGFRFINLADATLLTPGTVVSNALAPATKTDLYQFTAVAGDRYFFHVLSRNGLLNTWWRLMDPYGNQLFSQGFSDVGSVAAPTALNAAGTYTLMVEGYIGDSGSGTYSLDVVPEGNVTPAPLTGVPMNLGDLIASNLVANTTNSYTLTLNAETRVIIDPQTNSPGLTWTLQGPSGVVVNRQNLNASAGIYNFGPLDLPAGSYQLNLQGTLDSPYQFRLLDLASATPLTPGLPLTNAVSPASSTALYRFNAVAGARFFFDSLAVTGLPNAAWRLVDPNNVVVFVASVFSSQGPLSLSFGGTYTLLVEGYWGDIGSGSFGFNAVPVTDGLQALTPGSLVTGAISSPGQRQQYTFTLASAARLYFDSLTNNSYLRWSLDGPAGNVVNLRTFTGSDGLSIGNPVLALPAGSYTLTVVAYGDSVGPYQFRLFDLGTATPLTPGTAVVSPLSPANSTAAYQFTLSAPGKVYYVSLASSGLPNAYVRLLDPYGNFPITTYVGGSVGPVALLAGTYTLMVEGYIGDPGSGSYSFNIIPVTDGLQALTVGSIVNGAISSPGQHQQYTFTLAAPARLYFDALTNNSALNWSLDGPTGNVVNGRSFTSSDGRNIFAPVLALLAGNYTLTVSAYNGATSGFQFRLLDFAGATPLTLGTPVNVNGFVANSTDLYRFNAAAGDQFSFAYQASSGIPNASWRLIDPYNNVVFNQSFAPGVGTNTLPAGGTYTLLIEGYIGDTGLGSYGFNVTPVGNVPPIPFTGTPLSIGSVITGSLPTNNATAAYVFSLANPARLYFDALTNVSFNWTLAGPPGLVVNTRSFFSSDSADISDPVLPLPAGSYQLTVTGPAGGYKFQMLDLASAATITPGITVSNTLSPADTAVFYQFTGTAGQQLYFYGQPSSGFSYTPYCRLYAPDGNIILSTYINSQVDTFSLPQSGTYTFTTEGRVYDLNPSGKYAFAFLPVTYVTNALSLGQTISGTLATPGQQQFYTFTLPTAATLYFDALTNVNFEWRLDAPWGQIVSWRNFPSSDGADIGDPSLPLAPGSYTLTVAAGGNFTATGDYQFRLLNFANATPFVPGTVVSNALSPADSTVLYQFTGTAGDHYYFNGQLASGFAYVPLCRLYSPAGNILLTQNPNQDVDTFTLPQSGIYTLTVEGRIYDTHASGNYAFELFPNPTRAPQPLYPATALPDLVVSAVSVSPASGLQSGGIATVQWTDQNNGNGATSGSFTDRVTIRNSAGLVLADSFLPYTESDPGNGPLAPTAVRTRQLAMQLPDGTNSVGTLKVTVTVNAQNSIVESNTANNSSNTTFTVALAPYPELLVENVRAVPATGWLPGSLVMLDWRLTNSGAAFANTNWTDGILILNTNSGSIILNTTTNYNLADPGNGALAPGDFRDRALSFTVPKDANANGVFLITVTADSAHQLFEYSPNPPAGLSNSASLLVVSAPDLQVANLSVQPPILTSGTNLTVTWQDTNAGSAVALGSWFDRVTIVNTNLGLTLLDTTLYYDTNSLGALTNGSARDRFIGFTLPTGSNGAGGLLITVTADTFNGIFSYHPSGAGPNNKTMSILAVSQLVPLPDLVINSLTSTNTAFTSQIINAQLSLANQGLATATGDMLQRVFLSTTPTPGTGSLAAQADYNGSLAVGQSIVQAVSVLMPTVPGNYWLIAQADANDNIVELTKNNNYLVASAPINVVGAYSAKVQADVHQALANTPIPMHGKATLGGTSQPAAFVAVSIHVQVRGTDRTYTVLTAADGTFTNLFVPLPTEAGVYQLSAGLPGEMNLASQDSFVLLGMAIAQVPLVDLTAGASATNTARVDNLSDVALSGLTVTVVTNQPNLVVSASLDTNSLAGFASANLTVSVKALDASIFQSPVVLHVASAEGAAADMTFLVRVESPAPKLVLNPGSLQGAMLRGSQKPLAFTVANQGGAPTGPLQVVLPTVPWLSLASANLIPPLAPGSNSTVTILLTPAADLPLGTYNGSLVIQATNAATQEPFSFQAVSDSKGNMLVSAEDEYTYFATGSPRVTNALVVLSDALTGTPVITNFTGPDGTVLMTNLTEAFYIVDVSADAHSPFRQTALVAAGLTTNVVAFLARQTVTYSFTVTPTTVADQYIFTIDSTFETQVPIPVVTIDPASLDLAQYPEPEFQVLYTVANHGLIEAEDVKLVFPSTASLQITALVTNLGKLAANTSLTVPVLIKRLNPTNPPAVLATKSRSPKDYLSGTCSVTASMLWGYLCGPNVVDKSTAAYIFDSTGCNLVDLYSQVYDLVPDNPGGGGGGGGGGLITSQGFFDYLNSLNPVTDFEAPPGYHFQCKSTPPAIKGRTPKGATSVCAKVDIRLDQKGVITRDAFKATLEINNDGSNVLQNVEAVLQITDLQGTIVSPNFAISTPGVSGLTAVDGTGILPASTMGTATWTLIPTLDAAPTNGVTVYLVGGTLSYTQDGVQVSVPLAPAPIQVFPQPELLVRYFHDRDVFGPDPFSPQTEPSLPYSLAVQVNNVGYGPAQSLNITSGKPQIVDNVKGLLIDFTILGTQLENQPVTPSLSVDFGGIAPGTNRIARWLFISSLQGSFTNFSASFSEVDAFGKPRLSLVRSVEIHELTHIVDAGGVFEDSRPDFLVDDTPDPNHLPDTLYLSDGRIVPVTAVTNVNLAGTLTGTNLSITAALVPATGWSYLRFGDPGPGAAYHLTHVFRADHSEIPFGTNVWTTDRIFLGGDLVPIHTNLVHLVDYNSSGTYTLVYSVVATNGPDTIPPTSAVSALPASSPPTFTVQWSGTDNSGGTGIAFYDIYVSTNGGPFGPWITNTTVTAALFSGVANNSYAFFSRATDGAGNREAAHATPDTQTSTTAPGNSPPVITPIATQSIAQGGLFTLTPSATDTSLPPVTLTWSLLPGAPPAALLLPSTGKITWQTGPSDGGTTNTFALVVSDNGSPSLSATQSFNVVVTRVNQPPKMLPPPSIVTVNGQSPLVLQLNATDTDLPQPTLVWQLGPGAPTGLSLNPATGLLTWTPTAAQVPSTNFVTVIVRNSGIPALADTNTFLVVVNGSIQPPVLAPIADQVAYVLLPLFITNSASDPNVPARTLTFSLDPGAPAGAHIDAKTGRFTWAPARDQAPSTNVIAVRVTDDALPPLSAAQSFTVVVEGYLEVILGATTVVAGSPGAVTIDVDATTPLTNVSFILDVPSLALTNFTLAPAAPPLASATLQQTGPNQFTANFALLSGQTLSGPQTISTLNFNSKAGSISAFLPLNVTAASANQVNGVALQRTLQDNGSVALINGAPLLEGALSSSQLLLVLHALAGPSYTVESAPALNPPLIWSPIWNGPVGSSLVQVIPVPLTNAASFFRASVP